MKKIIGFLSLAAVLTTLSCTDKPAEVKKEVIVVPSSPTIIVKDPPAKSTTVTLDHSIKEYGEKSVNDVRYSLHCVTNSSQKQLIFT